MNTIALPEIKGRLAVNTSDDGSKDLLLVRTDISPPVEVAIVHNGTDRVSGEAEAYAHLLALSPPMLELLSEPLGAWAEQFDGPDNQDLSVSGADLVDWFAVWRLRVRAARAPANCPNVATLAQQAEHG